MGKASVVILRSNPVDPDSRVEKEANSLLKAGYDVKIIAWDRRSKFRVKETILNLSNGDVKIYRFGIPAKFGEGKKSLKAFLLFQLRMFKWLLMNKEKYQIIHACDFDTAYTAYLCNKFLNKKFIFDIFDFLFTDTSGRNSKFKKLIVHLQHTIINNVDGTIICTEERKVQIKGTKPNRLVIIHNSPPILSEKLSKRELHKENIKIVYVGILQDNRFLIELADVVQSISKCELHIGGFGKYEGYFKKLSKRHENIFYYGKIPYHKTLELENSCDIMTAIYDPAFKPHYYAAPNKFYESIMLGKPVIMVKNTGMSNVVAEHNIGEVIDYNKQSLKKAIRTLISRKSEWGTISQRARDIYEEYYSWSEMENRLIEFYENLNAEE